MPLLTAALWWCSAGSRQQKRRRQWWWAIAIHDLIAVSAAIAPFAAHCAACGHDAPDSLPAASVPSTALNPEARLLVRALLRQDEHARWEAANGVRELAVLGSLEWAALEARRLPRPSRPSRPTLLGSADTRNFSHRSLDESDAARVGAPLEVGFAAEEGSGGSRRPRSGSGRQRGRAGTTSEA